MQSEEWARRVGSDYWQAESLRFTAFLTPSADHGGTTWWREVVGDEPENTTTRSRGTEYSAEGSFEAARLVLSLKPRRVDWLLAPSPDPEQGAGAMATLGPLAVTLDAFWRAAAKWLGLVTCPPLQRLAFGAVLLHPVSDRGEGYRGLSTYLPAVQLDPQASRDFTYQINRPRSHTHDGLHIAVNRLSKWSVAVWRFAAFVPGSVAPRLVPSRSEFYACRLELDVNTDADFDGEFTRAQTEPLLHRLLETGIEIAREGDKP